MRRRSPISASTPISNLDGRDDTLGHDIMIAADHYLELDEHQVPTGKQVLCGMAHPWICDSLVHCAARMKTARRWISTTITASPTNVWRSGLLRWCAASIPAFLWIRPHHGAGGSALWRLQAEADRSRSLRQALRSLCGALPGNADLAGCHQSPGLPERGAAPWRSASPGNDLRLLQELNCVSRRPGHGRRDTDYGFNAGLKAIRLSSSNRTCAPHGRCCGWRHIRARLPPRRRRQG